VIPFILLSEFLAGTFPQPVGIALGLCFLVIVFIKGVSVAYAKHEVSLSVTAG
jgi:hypothetical protein